MLGAPDFDIVENQCENRWGKSEVQGGLGGFQGQLIRHQLAGKGGFRTNLPASVGRKGPRSIRIKDYLLLI